MWCIDAFSIEQTLDLTWRPTNSFVGESQILKSSQYFLLVLAAKRNGESRHPVKPKPSNILGHPFSLHMSLLLQTQASPIPALLPSFPKNHSPQQVTAHIKRYVSQGGALQFLIQAVQNKILRNTSPMPHHSTSSIPTHCFPSTQSQCPFCPFISLPRDTGPPLGEHPILPGGA